MSDEEEEFIYSDDEQNDNDCIGNYKLFTKGKNVDIFDMCFEYFLLPDPDKSPPEIRPIDYERLKQNIKLHTQSDHYELYNVLQKMNNKTLFNILKKMVDVHKIISLFTLKDIHFFINNYDEDYVVEILDKYFESNNKNYIKKIVYQTYKHLVPKLEKHYEKTYNNFHYLVGNLKERCKNTHDPISHSEYTSESNIVFFDIYVESGIDACLNRNNLKFFWNTNNPDYVNKKFDTKETLYLLPINGSKFIYINEDSKNLILNEKNIIFKPKLETKIFVEKTLTDQSIINEINSLRAFLDLNHPEDEANINILTRISELEQEVNTIVPEEADLYSIAVSGTIDMFLFGSKKILKKRSKKKILKKRSIKKKY